MTLVMLVTKVPFNLTILLTPVILIYLLLFVTGLSLILATLQVFFRDTAHLYNVFTLAWMYLTPIFYPSVLLEEKLNVVLILNPMVYYISYFRDIILNNIVPSLEQNIICLVIGLIFFIIGLVVFYKKQDKFILYI